ncbi:MAG: hypothetical protein IRZ13_02335 [Acetobacteraceae bacterium]|nr:hypothetical protein [Acetobacteraceae bacterium]
MQVNFAEDFDPPSNLTAAAASGTLPSLGEDHSALFLGRLVTEFSAEDFVLA